MRKKIFLTDQERKLSVAVLMDKYGISRATAFRAKARGWFFSNYHHTEVVPDRDFMVRWHRDVMKAINFAIRKWRSIFREDIFQGGVLSYHDLVGEVYLQVFLRSGLRPREIEDSRDRVFYWVFKVAFWAVWRTVQKHIFKVEDREDFYLKDKLNGRSDVPMDHDLNFSSSPSSHSFFMEEINMDVLSREERIVFLAYLYGWTVSEVMEVLSLTASMVRDTLAAAIQKLRRQWGVEDRRPYPPMPWKVKRAPELRAVRAKAAQKIKELNFF